jgi:glycosyltransferase involved in cell wall biosynthesis
MPCLNEAATLATCIAKARHFLEEQQVVGEVLIADNGSSDQSAEIAQQAGARVVHVPEKGYGAAILGGIKAAKGRYIIMGDADDSYDFAELSNMFLALQQGYQLVMGNRFAGGIAPGAMPMLHRYLGNPVLSFVGRTLFNVPIGDFHCGLRGFDRASILGLGLMTTGMEFASEMVVKAALFGLRITEVPVRLHKDGRERPPHLRTWRDGWRHLRFLLLFSPQWLFLYPGVLLTLTGTVAAVLLMQGPLRLGRVTFDIHTLLYAVMMVLIGFQLSFFYVFSKSFAISQQLLPDDDALKRLRKYFPLEAGILAGGALILTGLILTIKALYGWSEVDFGPLNAREVMRITVPSVGVLILGVQILFSAFLLSYFSLNRVKQ